MRIIAGNDDSGDFIAILDQVLDDLLRREEPDNLIVVKIDNWFGHKWLGFAGKAMGALATSHVSSLSKSFTIPRSCRRESYPREAS